MYQGSEGTFTDNNWKNAIQRREEMYKQRLHEHQLAVTIKWWDLKQAIYRAIVGKPEILLVMEKRIAVHDNSKFEKEEFPFYRQKFCSVFGESIDEEAFTRAREHHFKNNDHHWQFWLDDECKFLRTKSKTDKICSILEMVCDWK